MRVRNPTRGMRGSQSILRLVLPLACACIVVPACGDDDPTPGAEGEGGAGGVEASDGGAESGGNPSAAGTGASAGLGGTSAEAGQGGTSVVAGQGGVGAGSDGGSGGSGHGGEAAGARGDAAGSGGASTGTAGGDDGFGGEDPGSGGLSAGSGGAQAGSAGEAGTDGVSAGILCDFRQQEPPPDSGRAQCQSGDAFVTETREMSVTVNYDQDLPLGALMTLRGGGGYFRIFFADPSQDPIELAPLGWDDDNDIDRTYRYSFITARMDASSWVTLELAGSPVCRTVENDCLMCVSCRGTEMATLVLEPGPG